MQSTLGNLPEFFVVLFALNAGQLIVAQTAILGSILANALLVLGVVLVTGANRSRDGLMRFSPRLPNDTATLLLLASFMIVLLALATALHDPASHHAKTISIVGAVAMLIVYGTWLRKYLAGGAVPGRADAPRLSRVAAITMLAVAGGIGVRFGLVRARPAADDPPTPHLSGVRRARDRRDRG